MTKITSLFLKLVLTFLNSEDVPSPSAHAQVWCHSRQNHHTCNYENQEQEATVILSIHIKNTERIAY